MSVYGATSYAAPTTYAAAPATYAATPATDGAYGGMHGYGSPYLDTGVIETQKLDATNALKNQQKLQQTMALEQQYKNQTMQLDMAKQERDLMITSQAAQMTASAQQHQLQIEMQ